MLKTDFNLFENCEKARLSRKAKKELARARRLLEVLAHDILRLDEHPVGFGKKLGYETSDIDIIQLGMISLNGNANRTAKKMIGKL